MAETFIHRLIPGGHTALLLLHGTGGNENDLLEVGSSLLPGATLLSPRGKILENGMSRFFRRLAEGVFDEQDLINRTHELAVFVREMTQLHKFKQVVAVGYSNGANIAASLLLLEPGLLSGAVLWRAMVPLLPEKQPDLSGVPVLLAVGENDPMISPAGAQQLADMLENSGADLTVNWTPGGHQLTGAEIQEAARWLQTKFHS